MPEVEGDKQPKAKFKSYPLGYFHIDIAEVQTAEGKLHLFVAIDRTSKIAFAQLVEKANRVTASAFLVSLIAAVPYKIHTILTDNGIQFRFAPRYADGPTARYMTHMFDMHCRENGIEHRFTKINHPWTNGQVERMNRTIKDATVKRFHYNTHDQLRRHLADFISAYNFGRRLKTLKGLIPYEFICKQWAKEPERFRLNPLHQMPGLNTGASDMVFGLMPFFGFSFAPRLRDLKERKLHLPPGTAIDPLLAPMVDMPIEIDHIAAHWDELLRLATSIRSGTMTASTMLRKLSAYPRQNSLAVALRETGRLERNLFMLEWIRNSELRRRAQGGLNKGEARNALARALFFCQLGEVRDHTFENQIYRASGLNLLVAALILWNTRYLEVAAAELGLSPEMMRHVAPLAWEHLSLTGDYSWNADGQPAPGELRPLRTQTSLLVA